ncbi:hypothetical protein X760_09030 [Mesorhizobium sp. LSHC422A00]|nr:hypothetical protein X760_09030 [Mesorhizobium sp. LSHC422A00]
MCRRAIVYWQGNCLLLPIRLPRGNQPSENRQRTGSAVYLLIQTL